MTAALSQGPLIGAVKHSHTQSLPNGRHKEHLQGRFSSSTEASLATDTRVRHALDSARCVASLQEQQQQQRQREQAHKQVQWTKSGASITTFLHRIPASAVYAE